MNPNPDETSPASGRQQSKSLEEVATDAAIKLARNPLYRESTYAIILRALQAATAESEDTARLDWLEENHNVDKLHCDAMSGFGFFVDNYKTEISLRKAIDAARQHERSQR